MMIVRRTYALASIAASAACGSLIVAAPSAEGASIELPFRVDYDGLLTAGATYQRRQVLHLTRNGEQLSGTTDDVLDGNSVHQSITGSVNDGICTLRIGHTNYKGACDSGQYAGTMTIRGDSAGMFAFRAAGASARYGLNPLAPDRRPARPEQTDADRPQIPPQFRQDLPSDGNFDYVQGDDVPAEQSGPSGGGYAAPAPDAPAGTAWAYGRWRWVIQPGGGCAREAQLKRGYCFNAVIGWLRAHPTVHDITVVTLDRPTPLGAFVGRDPPYRYGYVQVKRNGNWFKGDKDLRGVAKVQTPPGCDFSPLREGFFLNSPGPQGLQEAMLFRCP